MTDPQREALRRLAKAPEVYSSPDDLQVPHRMLGFLARFGYVEAARKKRSGPKVYRITLAGLEQLMM